MKNLTVPLSILSILTFASASFAQNIGLTFDEAGTKPCIDGHTELVPNPQFGDLPSAAVYVGAWGLPELFGYEYKITWNEASAIAGTPVFYPSTSANFGTNGDVRVGTGMCFHVGDAEAGPDPSHIRLAKHTFTWVTLPAVNVLYCIGPSAASGAAAPQYTECVQTPVPLPFGVYNLYGPYTLYLPDGCIFVLFESAGNNYSPANCDEVVAAKGRSWGALKAAY